jgi:hypothetical protein
MKKLSLLAIAFVTFSIAQAQISKGSVFVGGSVIVLNQKIEQTGPFSSFTSQSNKQIQINPAVGIAIKENLVLGIELMYININAEQTTTSSSNSSTLKGNQYGGGLFARKFFPVAKNLYLFGQAGLNYQTVNTKQTEVFGNPNQPSITENKGGQTTLSLYPGITYALSKKFFLELGLNNLFAMQYTDMKHTTNSPYNNAGTSTEKTFSLSSSLNNASQFSIGARFIFPGK